MEFNSSITEKLTKQQIEVAKLLVLGNTYKQISSKLYITRSTVKKYLRDIYNKIDARNNAHAGYILGLKTIKKK